MSIVGEVGEIWRFPVKSMYGESIPSVLLEPEGIPSDRNWALWDEEADKLASGKKIPKIMMLRARYAEDPPQSFAEHHSPEVEIIFPDKRKISSNDPDAPAILSLYLGRRVRLRARQPASIFCDADPLHILTTASLEHIRSFYPEGDFRTERYRPSFTIKTDPALVGFAENDWQGGRLRVGDVVIDCGLPTNRCSMPGEAQPDIVEDRKIPHTVGRHAKWNLGIYATACASGVIHVGDKVEFLLRT